MFNFIKRLLTPKAKPTVTSRRPTPKELRSKFQEERDASYARNRDHILNRIREDERRRTDEDRARVQRQNDDLLMTTMAIGAMAQPAAAAQAIECAPTPAYETPASTTSSCDTSSYSDSGSSGSSYSDSGSSGY